jgi:hypothetical protein
MRLAIVFVLAGCSISPAPAVGSDALVGDVACGSATCHTGQLCVVVTSGTQCDVNYDAGIGPDQIIMQYCADVPAACGDTPTCDCFQCYGLCFDIEGRTAGCGCE